MESRKRPLIDAEESVVTKKRILTGMNGGPHVNGMSEGDEEEGFREKLETYRKEAIYRRMQHYSRENERCQARIKDLEHRKSSCEAGLTAIAACWTQLVETIKLFVKADDVPTASIGVKEIFDLATHIEEESMPDLASALSDTVNATQALVTKFVQLDDERKLKISSNEAFPECQKAQTECALLRSEVKLLQTRLQESESEKERYHDQLMAVENRLARSRSSVVQEVESKGKDVEGDGMDEKEEALRKPSSPAPSSACATPVITTNGVIDIPTEIFILKQQIKERERKIIEVDQEAKVWREERSMLQAQVKVPSFEQIQQSPYFRALTEQLVWHEMEEKKSLDQVTNAQEDARLVRQQLSERDEKYANTVAEYERTITDLNNKLIEKRDENARLRTARNQFEAENRERKALEGMRFSSIQELKTLTASNSERVLALESELKRCKSKLAVNAGSKDLLDFFLAGNHDETVYFEGVKEEKKRLANRVSALEQVFSKIDPDHPDLARHARAEADALERLSKANEELEDYRRIYGRTSGQPPDVTQLAEQLRTKDAELEQLRLSAKELEENQSSIYTELDQLAAQWETLDKQVKSKVFNLQTLEDKLQKTIVEKAKAETKCYEAFKALTASTEERKALQKDLEVEIRMRNVSDDASKKTHQLNNALESENAAVKKGQTILYQKLKDSEKTVIDLQAHLAAERGMLQELKTVFRPREDVLQKRSNELRAEYDGVMRMKEDLKRQLERAREVEANRHNKPSLVESELDNLRSLLQCTTCRGPPRSIIITKCMHTFCKPCIDTRLATRQRKCPACNVPFGASDVHTFFLQ